METKEERYCSKCGKGFQTATYSTICVSCFNIEFKNRNKPEEMECSNCGKFFPVDHLTEHECDDEENLKLCSDCYNYHLANAHIHPKDGY